jgi:protein-tyrosine phosphatase
LRGDVPPGPAPEWALYLLATQPSAAPWPSRWLRWSDFWLPKDPEDARAAFEEAHRRAAVGMRVEVACGGGRGRTGTALACIAQIAGVNGEQATTWIREHYHPRAVETPSQRRFVRGFGRSGAG